MNILEKIKNEKKYGEDWSLRIDKILNKFNNFKKNGDCYIWSNTNSIVKILNEISNECTHLFFPSSGGMHFNGCNISRENNFIELKAGGIYRILPNKLYFYREGGVLSDYFILETRSCNKKLHFNVKENGFEEVLIEDTYGNIYEYSDGKLEELSERGEDLNKYITYNRCFKNAKYAISSEFSFYNSQLGFKDEYNGKHNKLSLLEFNKFIKEIRTIYDEIKKEKLE